MSKSLKISHVLILLVACFCIYRLVKIYNKKTNIVSEVKIVASDELCHNCKMKIPKIIHRIWIPFTPDKRNVPEEYVRLDKILKDLHPDWRFMEWNEEQVDQFMRENYPEHYDTLMNYDVKVKKHDAARYFILKHYGGVFMQHSFVVYKNIEPLLRGYDVVISTQQSTNEVLNNAFMAASPNHKLFEIIIANLAAYKEKHVLDATGPHFLTFFIKEYFSKYGAKGINILSTKFIFPFDWVQKGSEPIYSDCIVSPLETYEQCRKLFPEMYAYCLWRGAWLNVPPVNNK